MKVYWSGKHFYEASDTARETPVTPTAGDTLDFTQTFPGYGAALAELDLKGGDWITAANERQIVTWTPAHQPQVWKRRGQQVA